MDPYSLFSRTIIVIIKQVSATGNRNTSGGRGSYDPDSRERLGMSRESGEYGTLLWICFSID